MSTTIDITQFAPEIEKLAASLKKRYELGVSVEDLCSAGYEALHRLALSGKYDSAQGEFWPWAYKHVLNRMIHEVSLHGGRTRRQQAAHRANLAARVTARPVTEMSERERFMHRWAVVDGTAVGYQLDAELESTTPEDELLEAERKQLDGAAITRLLASIKRLPERQRRMIVQRYVDDTALNDVAANFGITKSRACHILRKTREKLRLAMELAPEHESET